MYVTVTNNPSIVFDQQTILLCSIAIVFIVLGAVQIRGDLSNGSNSVKTGRINWLGVSCLSLGWVGLGLIMSFPFTPGLIDFNWRNLAISVFTLMLLILSYRFMLKDHNSIWAVVLVALPLLLITVVFSMEWVNDTVIGDNLLTELKMDLLEPRSIIFNTNRMLIMGIGAVLVTLSMLLNGNKDEGKKSLYGASIFLVGLIVMIAGCATSIA